jgi:flagellar biosynthesis protein FlhB
MDETELDKSEAATPFKLKRAREKGNVARGVDLGFFGALTGFVAYAWLLGNQSAAQFADISIMTLTSAADASASPRAMMTIMGSAMASVFSPLLAFAGMIFLVALALDLFQVGPVFSAQALKPDFNRISPTKGLKRLFSIRLLIEAAKSVLKLVGYGIVAWLVVDYALGLKLLAMPTAFALTAALGSEGSRLVVFFALVAGAFAALDQLLTRRDFAKRMRMSRRELKREHRDREGDPRLKQKRKAFHSEFIKMARSLRNARNADVILVNPTHYAIALRYDPGSMGAPQIVSRGAGALAERIRRIGFVYGVKVLAEPVITRALFRTGILEDEIPDSLFGPVADLYRSRDLLPAAAR